MTGKENPERNPREEKTMERIEVLEIVNAAMKANIQFPEIEFDVEVNRDTEDEIACKVTIWNRYEPGVQRKIIDSLSSYSTIETDEGETRIATAEDLMQLIEKYAKKIPEEGAKDE